VFAAPVGAKEDDQANTWETLVYVQDKILFPECVEWKYQDTKKQWEDHTAFLEA
jgi:hypothetical protein